MEDRPSQSASLSPHSSTTTGQVPSPFKDVVHVPTETAYELWAPYYDTDGNFLQAQDTLELETLLPAFLSRTAKTRSTRYGMRVIDLGCGTGRNTLQLLSHVASHRISFIGGIDLSPAMLGIALERMDQRQSELGDDCAMTTVFMAPFDISSPTATEDFPEDAEDPDAVISTLVLEHVQLDQYFKVCASFMTAGSRLLITNMHNEQGKISGAGFVDPVSGKKVRAESFPHTVADVVAIAKEWGFDVDGEILEKGVDSEELVKQLGTRSRKWFEAGIKTWFAIEFLKTS